ncbi:MAG: hypothetical protein H7235_06685 [Bdellovibrionaceae bacterium]|nr:hypothetical protein [Pseudobdellovibrionaceae bacterium]
MFKLPFQAQVQREGYLKAVLAKLNHSHIICDATTYQELRVLLNQTEHSTLTVLTDSHLLGLPKKTFQILMNHQVFSLSYFLHQAYLKLRNINTPSAAEVGLNIPPETYHKILDHCVKLAEMDFYDVDLTV